MSSSSSAADRPYHSFCAVFLANNLGSPPHYADSRWSSLSEQAVHRGSPEEAVPETCQSLSSRCLRYLSKCPINDAHNTTVYRRNSSTCRMLIKELRPRRKVTPYLRKTCSTYIGGRIRRNRSDMNRNRHSTRTCMRAIKGRRSSSRSGSAASSQHLIRPHTTSF